MVKIQSDVAFKISFQTIILVLCLNLLTTANAVSDPDEEEEPHPCGQYGFICVDEKTIEFCPIVIDDDATDKPDIFVCDDHFVCDEDNPTYCTPKEEPNKFLHDQKKEHQEHQGFDDSPLNAKYYADDEYYYRQARAVPASDEDNNNYECETTTPDDDLSTTTEYEMTTDANSEFTTAPPFECDTFGFFPDPHNTSLFYHCDVSLNGNGFLLRHMKCGMDRYFDDNLRICVLQGTIRQERKYNHDINSKKIEFTSDCMNQRPGKYADKFDCHIYHICLSKQYSPAIQLSFICPRHTAYCSLSQSCTKSAYKRCESKKQKPTNINCTTPMRFRSIDDCRSYFVCYVDNVIEIKCPKFYKFDDSSMECLPEKESNCQEIYV